MCRLPTCAPRAEEILAGSSWSATYNYLGPTPFFSPRNLGFNLPECFGSPENEELPPVTSVDVVDVDDLQSGEFVDMIEVFYDAYQAYDFCADTDMSEICREEPAFMGPHITMWSPWYGAGGPKTTYTNA